MWHNFRKIAERVLHMSVAERITRPLRFPSKLTKEKTRHLDCKYLYLKVLFVFYDKYCERNGKGGCLMQDASASPIKF